MQRSQRIHFEIEKRNGGRAIVRRLRGGVDDQVRPHFVEQRQHALAVPNIERRMPVTGDLLAQVLEHPTGVALRPEENGPMIVVDPVNLESLVSEEPANLGANQPARTCDNYLRHVLLAALQWAISSIGYHSLRRHKRIEDRRCHGRF
jgi:hypothetical protein